MKLPFVMFGYFQKGSELPMSFSHCEHDETHLSLHDCIAQRAYLENGKLGFELSDGFRILPDHPESHSSDTVRTGSAKVEYTLYSGECGDVTVYVFEETLFKRTLRTEWTVEKLVYEINKGKCMLEFLYQYRDPFSVILECQLRFLKKPYFKECSMKIFTTQTDYYWNDLYKDKIR